MVKVLKIWSMLLLVILLVTPAQIASANAVDDLVWESITFGQSTDLDFAANTLPEKVGVNFAEPEFPGTIEGDIFMESRGGKLAPGHDGLTFYYTTLDPRTDNFVLEADLTFHQLGPETGASPSGQEGAGIMVRDVNGSPRQDPMIPGYEEVPAASNLAAVGLMRGGVSALARKGVTEPWGNPGSTWINNVIPGVPNLPMDTPVRLKLERTDTEFVMSATFTHVEDEPVFEQRIAGADLVQVMDPEAMQVGFYAARNAEMTVSNASLSISEANTIPTPEQPVAEPDAEVHIVSAQETGSDTYEFKTLANYEGTLTLWKDGEEVVTNEEVQANEVFVYSSKLHNEKTLFELNYRPSGAPSDEAIKKDLTVTKRVFKGGPGLFVAPNGSKEASGKKNDPLDLETAIKYVKPGESIFMREGIYSKAITISQPYSGEKGKLKSLVPYKGETVVFDGNYQEGNLISLNADYWHIAGFELTQSTGNGMRVNGSNNLIELMTFSYNQNTGFQISGSGTDPDKWPKHNLIINSEAHDNRDPSDINADGFAAKLGVGEGNVFQGNIARNNIDDGWDLYNRTNEGANMPVTLNGNISYSNGKLSDGYNEEGTSGSGFKVGGEGLPVAHSLKNNLAFDNNMDGFTDNFNPGRIVMKNNTSVDNKRYNYIFRINPYFESEDQGVFKNNISFHTDPEHALGDFVSGVVDETNFFFDGTQTMNSEGIIIDESHFESTTMPDSYERDKDGALLWGNYMRLSGSSSLITAGENGSYVGALPPTRISKNPPLPKRPVTPLGPPVIPPGHKDKDK
ncbi:right-handed parallel beta-helix repeat-containing protein [Alkalicoccobacillus porphyridii]|uniref:Right-handed parallel beta-helix repeat-containing protein n=1 Tax=Alkalicoccobacillus porphyridii TaxID=2597270 RepID=A0A554A212_9BACI|nr:right-handed parallel beta-helix repeat-containing protein [Alkalicoccobacillus porphyridii]TSB47728.1 right-handed parallel beta-helix repeat-containing protein [Alkalicoccobacillus porphyridii]